MKTNDGKSILKQILRNQFSIKECYIDISKVNSNLLSVISSNQLFVITDTTIKIIKFKGDREKMRSGAFMEIRGIVNKDNTISYGEFT